MESFACRTYQTCCEPKELFDIKEANGAPRQCKTVHAPWPQLSIGPCSGGRARGRRLRVVGSVAPAVLPLGTGGEASVAGYRRATRRA